VIGRAALAAILAVTQFGIAGASAASAAAAAKRVGILCAVTCATSDVGAFRGALASLGYQEGPTIAFESRSADGDLSRLPDLAGDLVALRVDLIFTTWGTAAALSAKRATSEIPIVVGSAGDLVAAGLARSLSHPGGNVTGISSLALDLEGKRLDLLKLLVPSTQVVAVFRSSSNPYSMLAIKEERAAAGKLGVTLREIEVHEAADVDAGFAAMVTERVAALSIHAYVPILASRDRIVELATKNRVAAIYPLRQFVEAGGLISYGASLNDNARRAAVFADKILRGTKPADLPVEQPTKIELVINMKAAQALGLTVPQAILARADEVIE
jgi:ABC-type uncharacterized transport system substrate-binding protein